MDKYSKMNFFEIFEKIFKTNFEFWALFRKIWENNSSLEIIEKYFGELFRKTSRSISKNV